MRSAYLTILGFACALLGVLLVAHLVAGV